MSTPDPTASAREKTDPLERAASREGEEAPWIPHGIAAGVLGAFLVALFFLVVDALDGRPLWTPAALGSALFLGESLPAEASPPALLVTGYTGAHGVVFLAIGLIGAFLTTFAARLPSSDLASTALLSALLFVAFELIFLSLGSVFMQGQISQLGAGRVALANLLAALGMGGYLVRRVRPPLLRRMDHR